LGTGEKKTGTGTKRPGKSKSGTTSHWERHKTQGSQGPFGRVKRTTKQRLDTYLITATGERVSTENWRTKKKNCSRRDQVPHAPEPCVGNTGPSSSRKNERATRQTLEARCGRTAHSVGRGGTKIDLLAPTRETWFWGQTGK